MSEPAGEFRDDELKAALQRAFADHRAPAGRRDAIEAMLRTELGRQKSIRSFWRPALAVAASIAIIAALTGFYLHHRHEQEEYEEYYVANEPLYKTMLASHRSNTVVGDPVETLEPAKFANLASRLNRFVPDLAAIRQGWSVDSILICRTKNGEGAIVHLSRDGKKLTFLTLPVAEYANAEENEPYEYLVENHPIAGIAIKGGIHCTVGDAGVSTDQLRELSGFIREAD